MSSPDERQRFLSEHEPFCDLPQGLLALISGRLGERSFAKHETLLTRGDEGDCLMVITDGRVRVSVPTPGGGHQLATIGKGGVIGEMALLTRRPRNADVIATCDTSVLTLPVEAFDELLMTNPELAVVLTSLLADRLGQDRVDGLGATELEGYRIGDCLGRGGMAIVYRATRMDTGQQVALKMMSHRLVYDRNALRRFQREADVAERFDHVHIARLLGRFEAYRTFFLIMELCDGPTLADVTRHAGPLDQDEVRAILGQIAQALQHVHGHGVIHRDLKPSNVLLNADGQLKLADFGLARPELLSDITQSGAMVGTPSYMSPEQLSGNAVDERIDIYALGCTAYELLTGRRLFPETNLAALITRKICFDLPPASEIRPGLSDDLYDLLARSLALDPDTRTFRPAEIVGWAAPLGPDLLRRVCRGPSDPDAPTETSFE